MWPCPRGANPALYKLQSPRAGNGDASSGRLLLRRVPAALGKWETCFPPSGLYSCLASSRAHYVNCQSARGRSLPFSIFPFWKTEPGAAEALGSHTLIALPVLCSGPDKPPAARLCTPTTTGAPSGGVRRVPQTHPVPPARAPGLLLGQKATAGLRRPGRRSPTALGRGGLGERAGAGPLAALCRCRPALQRAPVKPWPDCGVRLLLGRVSLIKAEHREGLSCGFLFQLVKWMGGRRGEGEINPQLYGNEALPPLCQRRARPAANLSGVDHLGSSPRAAALPKALLVQRRFHGSGPLGERDKEEVPGSGWLGTALNPRPGHSLEAAPDRDAGPGGIKARGAEVPAGA